MPGPRILALAAASIAIGFVAGTTIVARAADPAGATGASAAATATTSASPPAKAAAVRKPRATAAPAGPRRARVAKPSFVLPPPTLDATGCGTRGGVLAHGPRREPVVAVTFDACPTTRSPGFAPEIVDLLERERVPTTFFVSGRWAETHPEAFARLRKVPFFEIALHGHRHRHLVHGAPDAMLAEIEEGRAALRGLGAEPLAVFRPPFGDSPPELAEVARRAGVVALTWDVAPGDPDPQVSAATIERGVTTRSEPGSVVVLHVNGRGVGTPKALPGLLAGLRARGFRLARVSEVLAPCSPTTATADTGLPAPVAVPTPRPGTTDSVDGTAVAVEPATSPTAEPADADAP